MALVHLALPHPVGAGGFHRVEFKPVAERATIQQLLRTARRSIRCKILDLEALHRPDATTPDAGSVVQTLLDRARQGAAVEVVVDASHGDGRLAHDLREVGIRVVDRREAFRTARDEIFVIDDREALVLSIEPAERPGLGRAWGIQSDEPEVLASARAELDRLTGVAGGAPRAGSAPGEDTDREAGSSRPARPESPSRGRVAPDPDDVPPDDLGDADRAPIPPPSVDMGERAAQARLAI